MLLDARKENGLEINMEEIKRPYAPVSGLVTRIQEQIVTYILMNNFKRWVSLNIGEWQ
jgi:hypothetical protein